MFLRDDWIKTERTEVIIFGHQNSGVLFQMILYNKKSSN